MLSASRFPLAMLPTLGVPVDRWRTCLAEYAVLCGGRGAVEVRRHLEPQYVHVIALGTGQLTPHSLVAARFPNLNPKGLSITEPCRFAGVAVVVTLVLLGQASELRARRRTGTAIRRDSWLRHRPCAGWSGTGRSWKKLRQGEIFLACAGENRVDGKIMEGESRVDESMITEGQE